MRPRLLSLVLLGLVVPAQAWVSFPGADGRVVFTSGADLFTVMPDGRGIAPLTNTPGVEEAQAAWSPDGARIAFRVGTAGTSDVLQIAVMNADGTGRTVITSGDHHSSQPAWSPDGRRIVFRRSVPGQNLSGDVWAMDADGDSPHQLVELPGDERYPTFSPDGQRLAFTTHPIADGDTEIAVSRADGQAPTDITDNALFDSAPAGHPTGTGSPSSADPKATIPGTTLDDDRRTAPDRAAADNRQKWSGRGTIVGAVRTRIAFATRAPGTSDIWTMRRRRDSRSLAALPGGKEDRRTAAPADQAPGEPLPPAPGAGPSRRQHDCDPATGQLPTHAGRGRA